MWAGALALAACAGDEHSDLKQELNQLTKDFRGRVDPLPQVKPYEPVPYTAEGQVDPFRPQRIDVAQRRLSQSALKELIQDGGGEWVERNSALQLVETKR